MSNDTYSYKGEFDQGTAASFYNSLVFIVRQEIARLSTASVVKIVRAPYDKDGNAISTGSHVPVGFVDVQPLVNQIDGYGNATPHGTVYRLSYHRAQGGTNAIIIDPKIGDVGHMIVSDRDTSSVRATGKQANPGSRRKMDKADGAYVSSTQGPYDANGEPTNPTQWITFTSSGIEIHDQNGNSIVMGPSGVLINGALINLAGDVISKKGTDLDTHVHTGVMTGGDNTGPPA